VACAALGFIVAPASGALGSVWALAHSGGNGSGWLLAAAAALGALVGAFAVTRERPRGTPRRPAQARRAEGHRKGRAILGAAGPLLAAAALVAACLAGPFAAAVLALLVAALTGGLAAAVAGSAMDVTTAGAMAGVAICVTGAEVGCLGQGAIQRQLAGAAPWALVTALGWWELAGAAVALTIAVIRYIRQARAHPRTQPRTKARALARGDDRADPRDEPLSGGGSGQARPVHG
jgi:hypothetical protein